MRSSQQPIFQHWLKLQCQMSNNSPQGLLVHFQEGRKPSVEARVSLTSTESPVVMDDRHMIDAAKQVLEKQRLHLLKTDENTVFLGYPIVIDEQFWGAVVLQVESCNSSVMQSIIKLLQWGGTWLQFIIHSRTHSLVENTVFKQGDPKQLLSLMMSAIQQKSLTEAAIATVNFIATQFGFERVSLGFEESRRMVLCAVSFSASFDSKSENMRSVVNSMEEAVEQKNHLSVSHIESVRSDNEAPLITRAHKDTLDKHSLKSINTYVLRTQESVLGALTIENTRSDAISAEAEQFVDSSLSMLAAIFHLKKGSEKTIRRLLRERVAYSFRCIFGSAHLYSKGFALAGCLLFASFFVTGKFYINNDAVLESMNKYLLVSPYEGFVRDIFARPGDSVSKGQVLAQLKDDDLSLEQRKLLGQVHQYKIEYDNALANSNRVEAAILEAQITQSQVALDFVEAKLSRVKLVSPIQGVVVSDDVSQSIGAPIKQGDVLFEIADSGKYKLTLYVDERNVIYFKQGQSGEVSLTSLPETKIAVTVDRITPVSEVKNSRNYFRVDASFDGVDGSVELERLRPGMSGSAKIYIDRRALSWIWFHEIWYWLRLVLWI